MRDQNAPRKNVHNTSGAQPPASYPRRAALVGMLLSVSSAFALSPGCKSYATCEETKTCPDGEPSGDGDGQGGMGGTPTNTEVSCTESEIECDGDCINPDTSVNFCGATGSCRGDSAGTTCDADEICVEGACELDCDEGLILCDGTCIDPLTNDDYCGAGEACTGAVTCGENLECIQGECFGWSEVGTVDFGVQIGQHHVLLDHTGTTTAVVSHSGGLYMTQLNPNDQDWSMPERRDIVDTPVSAASVKLEKNAHDQVMLTWTQPLEMDAPRQLWVASRNDSGTWAQSTPLTVSADADVRNYAVSLDDEGNAFAVWEQFVNDIIRSVWWSRRLSSEANWTTPEELVPQQGDIHAMRLAPIIGGESLLVFFSNETDTAYEIRSEAGELDVANSTNIPDGQFNPILLETDHSGRAVLLGRESGLVVVTSDGSNWSGQHRLDNVDADLLDGAFHPSGAITLVWRENLGQVLTAAYYDPIENAWSENNTLSETVLSAALAQDHQGGVRILWSELLGDPASSTIWHLRQDAEGNWSSPLAIVEGLSGTADCRMAFNIAGHGVVSWRANPSDTLGFAYFGPQTPAED